MGFGRRKGQQRLLLTLERFSLKGHFLFFRSFHGCATTQHVVAGTAVMQLKRFCQIGVFYVFTITSSLRFRSCFRRTWMLRDCHVKRTSVLGLRVQVSAAGHLQNCAHSGRGSAFLCVHMLPLRRRMSPQKESQN